MTHHLLALITPSTPHCHIHDPRFPLANELKGGSSGGYATGTGIYTPSYSLAKRHQTYAHTGKIANDCSWCLGKCFDSDLFTCVN